MKNVSYNLFVMFLLSACFSMCSSNSNIKVEDCIEGSNISETKVFDSLNNYKRFFTEYYSEVTKEWTLNEDIYFDENGEILADDSFYSKVKISNNCFDAYLSDYYGIELDSSVLILELNNNIDTIYSTNNFNNFHYCLPKKYSGKVRLIFKAIFLAEKSDAFSEYIRVTSNVDSLSMLSSSIVKNICIE
jgi:hypothetical protein